MISGVKLPRCIQVVVIYSATGVAKLHRLVFTQHAEGAADLEAHVGDLPDRLENGIELGAVMRTSRQAAPMQNREAPPAFGLAGLFEDGRRCP
jgi:hypothetical protein